MRRILVLLNARAGTLVDLGPDRIVAALASLREGGRAVEVRLVQPKKMPDAIRDAARSDHDALIVGGGDGTANLAATALSGSDKILGVLPFGTMNLFARDLGMPADPEAAIAALAQARPCRIDLASVNGRLFHTLSGIGFFSQMARAREETRGHPLGRLSSVAVAAWRALRRSGRFRFEIAIDDRTEVVDASAVLITVNRFGADWRRTRLDGGALELHIAESSGALGLAKAGADLLTGSWRDNPGIRSLSARRVAIRHVRKRVWTATDGELLRLRLPLTYEVRPKAVTVLLAPPVAEATPTVRAGADEVDGDHPAKDRSAADLSATDQPAADRSAEVQRV
ncbi:putative sphingosine kinase [Rhodovulum sp. PH10]|uniref:diacylglycerol/lipid kinase family protein n=1 Tax=Rhodovulum sp. PH10 TaxID=1187851 RepID=UPI00027C2B70|nr:diacylglycerol kinase family protein [Rhodovulum sp. PH10]EJW11157.1 putative sphingosine kinase [Rhodovulum sp. PH10]